MSSGMAPPDEGGGLQRGLLGQGAGGSTGVELGFDPVHRSSCQEFTAAVSVELDLTGCEEGSPI